MQTCEIHEIPTLAFQTGEWVSTHLNLASGGGGLLMIGNNNTEYEPLSGNQMEGKQSTYALPNKTSQKQVSSTITRPLDETTYDDD